MTKEKQDEKKEELREILIQTDGEQIIVPKNTIKSLELRQIFITLLNQLDQAKK